MSITQSKIYGPGDAGTVSQIKAIINPVFNMIYMRALRTGSIGFMGIYLASAASPLNPGDPSANLIFQAKVNGSAIFSDGDKPEILNGQSEIEIENVGFEVNKYDTLVLDLEQLIGRASRSITWIVEIGDA